MSEIVHEMVVMALLKFGKREHMEQLQKGRLFPAVSELVSVFPVALN